MCSKDARFHCGRHGGGKLYRLDEANWRAYVMEGPADPTNLLALMIRDCHNDRFKLRLQICCEFSGPLPSEDVRKGVYWDGRLPTRIAGIRVLLNQSCAPWQPVTSISFPLMRSVLDHMSCLCHRTESRHVDSIVKYGLMPGKHAGTSGIAVLQLAPPCAMG